MDLGEGDSIAAIARISQEEVELSEQTHAASVAAGESAPRRSGKRALVRDVEEDSETEVEIADEESDYSEEDEGEEDSISAD